MSSRPRQSLDRSHSLDLFERETELKSCCGNTTDKRLIIILIQFLFSAVVIILCFVRIMQVEDCPNQTLFISLLSSTLSFWMGKLTSK